MTRVSRHYNFLSFVYDALDWPFEAFRYPRIRRMMCGDLSGKVLDAGVGTGKTLEYYSSGVAVTGVDLSEGMLARAEDRVRHARASVDLKVMDVTRLDFPDDTFDAAVASYMFCVMPDNLQVPALRELLRVTKPGGQVRILEHRYSRRGWRRLMQKLYAPYVKWFFRSRYDHPIGEAISATGARVLEERYVTSDVEKMYVLQPDGNGRGAGARKN